MPEFLRLHVRSLAGFTLNPAQPLTRLSSNFDLVCQPSRHTSRIAGQSSRAIEHLCGNGPNQTREIESVNTGGLSVLMASKFNLSATEAREKERFMAKVIFGNHSSVMVSRQDRDSIPFK